VAESTLKRTPLHECHLEAGARLVPFAGWEMPVQYGGVVEEHRAVRERAGLFDVSHMGEIEVWGPAATDFLQSLTPNDVTRLVPGQAHYSALLTESGTFLDDLLVYRLGDERFLLVVNAGPREGDLEWIRTHAPERGVEVTDRSEETALIALQGPRSSSILAPLTTVDLGALRYYHFIEGTVGGVEVLLSRTGYTGEDGFEIYADPTSAPGLWRRLLDTGAGEGLVPAGLGARDTLRLEAGMLLSGQDFDRQITPLEVGLGWIVKLKKGPFVGSEALARQKAAGVPRRLVGFTLVERGIARHGHPVTADGSAGTVTSGGWSPTLEKAIGLAMMEPPVEGSDRTLRIEARTAETPFYERAR
jgi:aminomethyltransferase